MMRRWVGIIVYSIRDGYKDSRREIIRIVLRLLSVDDDEINFKSASMLDLRSESEIFHG